MSSHHQHLDRAWQHQAAGELSQAEALCLDIVRAEPSAAGAWNLLGVVSFQAGKAGRALECFERAIGAAPSVGDYRSNWGAVLQNLGRHDEAESKYREALQLDPGQPEARNNLGNVLSKLGRIEEAIVCFRRALELRPDYQQALNNLSAILVTQGRALEALPFVQRSLELQPVYPEAHNNLGTILQELGRFEEAEASYRRALALRPETPEAHNNLGKVLQELGRVAESEASFRRAPDFVEAHFNLALLMLLQGDYERGWAEYEWRWRLPRMQPRAFAQPRWQGEPLAGRIILLHAEQGLGDTLQFVRYAPLVKQRGGTVVLECQKDLASLLGSCAGIDRIVPQGSALPPFDVHVPLMSLPLVLKTVPASSPYLRAATDVVARWQQELSAYPEFRIGIVWQGNPMFAEHECQGADRKRSIPLAQFASLARLPGVRLFSLQKGYGTEQLAGRQWGIVALGDRLRDFMETAGVMMNLDLIISADTATLHLAGALGRPAWGLIPFSGCWRWLQHREDSPWYPTMRLFRQSRLGEWNGVFERIARGVQSLVGAEGCSRRL